MRQRNEFPSRRNRGPSSPFTRAAVCGLAILCLFQSACLTTREAKGAPRTRIGFRQGAGEADDSEKIRSQFAEKGWKVDETGQIRPTKEENSNLYSGQEVKRGRAFKKEDSKYTNQEVKTKDYRTPEYLQRQQDFKTGTARDGDILAREGAYSDSSASETGRRARTDQKPGFLSGLNPFRTKTAPESNETFRTSPDREATRAMDNAAVADGVPQSQLGFYKDSVQTMDDVKRLLHPEAFD